MFRDVNKRRNCSDVTKHLSVIGGGCWLKAKGHLAIIYKKKSLISCIFFTHSLEDAASMIIKYFQNLKRPKIVVNGIVNLKVLELLSYSALERRTGRMGIVKRKEKKKNR